MEAEPPAEEEKLHEIVAEVAEEVIPSVAEQQEEAPLPVAPAAEPEPSPAPVEPSASVAEALAAAEAAAASESIPEPAAAPVRPAEVAESVEPAKPVESAEPVEATPKVVKQTKRVVKKVQHRKPVEFSLGAYAKVPLGATVSIGAGSVAPAAPATAVKSEGAKKEGRRAKEN